MFPYVRRHLQAYLDQHWDEEQLQADVKLLRELSQQDAANGVSVRTGESRLLTVCQNVGLMVMAIFRQGVPVIPEEGGDKATILAKVVENVTWQMDQDRKSTALKGTCCSCKRSSF